MKISNTTKKRIKKKLLEPLTLEEDLIALLDKEKDYRLVNVTYCYCYHGPSYYMAFLELKNV